jgi:hypothetical protein
LTPQLYHALRAWRLYSAPEPDADIEPVPDGTLDALNISEGIEEDFTYRRDHRYR